MLVLICIVKEFKMDKLRKKSRAEDRNKIELSEEWDQGISPDWTREMVEREVRLIDRIFEEAEKEDDRLKVLEVR